METITRNYVLQRWSYIATKSLISAVDAAVLFIQIYYDGDSAWDCLATATHPHPNPVNGDVDVSQEFALLLQSAFALAIMGILSSILAILVRAFKAHRFLWLISILDAIIILAAVVWLICGTVIRFSHTGRVCSGSPEGVSNAAFPYSTSTGEFLKIFIISLFIID